MEYPLHEENPDQESGEELLIDLDDFYDLLMEKCKTSRHKEEKDVTISTEGSY